MGSPWPQE
jgi:translation initiation factor IF-3